MARKTPRFSVHMGRRQFRGDYANSSYQALNSQFQSSMDDIMANFNEFVAHLENVSADILVEALEPTFGKALEYCPIQTGELRSSGYLEAESYRGGARAEMGFGRNGSPDYAIFVHEMPRWHEPPTRSHFLRDALDEDYYQILRTVPRLISEASGAA